MDKLVTLFSSVLDAFIAPQYLASSADKVQSRALVGLLLASVFNFFVVAFGMGLFYPFTAAGKQVGALACLTTIAGLTLALLLVRYTRWRYAATHLLILSVYFPIVLAAGLTGGIDSPVAPVLVWMPVIAGFLFNWKLGLSWLAVAVLTAVGLFLAPRFGIELVSVVPASNLAKLHFAMLIFNLIGIGAFIIVYSLINYHVVNELSGQRREYERLANYDVLTSLPNRMNFHTQLELAIQQAQRDGEKVGLLVMDLNKFKSINDTYGHSVGDELLHHMARRLIEHVRDSDFVARLSGDEFVVIMENVSRPDDVSAKAQSLIEIVEQPYALSVGRVKLGVSIGGAVYPDQEVEEAALFSRADLAMFYAKKHRLGFYMDVLPSNDEDYITQIKSLSARQSA